MITSIEKAKSSLSFCKGCKSAIEKDTYRGVEEVLVGNGIVSKWYYCPTCTLSLLDLAIERQQELRKEIKSYVKNQSR